MADSKDTEATSTPSTKKKGKPKPAFSNSSYLGFAAYIKTEGGDWKLTLNWRRIISIVIALVIGGYCAIAGLRYANDKYNREWEGASFKNSLIMPFSEDAQNKRRKALGEFYMAKARDAKTPSEVIANVRTALGYDEKNSGARISFSYLIFYQRMVHEAVEFLAEGLPDALDHNEYPTYFVRRCLSVSEDDTLINCVKECIPKINEMLAQTNEKLSQPTLPESQRKTLLEKKQILEKNHMILAVGAIQASILRGYFAQANQLLKEYDLEKYVPGKVLAAQILWESGEEETAIKYLDRAVTESRGDAQIVLLRALYLAALGQTSTARSTLSQAAITSNSPDIRVRLIALLKDEGGNQTLRQRMIDDYIQRYKNDPRALLLLSQYATEQNDIDLVTRIFNIANERVFLELPRFEMQYLEALIAAGKPKEALLMMDQLSQENMAWVEANSATIDGLKAIAYFTSGDETLGKLHLERTLKNRSITAAQLVSVGKRLADMGRLDEARSAYETAFNFENYNNMALVSLVNYALEKRDVDALMKYLPRLLDSRRPPRGVLERARRFLASDRMMFLPDAEKYHNRVSEILRSKDGVKLYSEPTEEHKTTGSAES